MNHDDLTNDIQLDEFRRLKSGQELVNFHARLQEHREQCAHALLSAGLHLIPSEHLNDNQFVVSRGVWEAAQRITKDGGPSKP